MGRPEPEFNYISPDDIGDVCGAILAGAFKGAHENPLYLCGPETDLSVADALGAIGRASDKPVKVTKVDIDENIQVIIKVGMPEHEATFLINNFANRVTNFMLIQNTGRMLKGT